MLVNVREDNHSLVINAVGEAGNRSYQITGHIDVESPVDADVVFYAVGSKQEIFRYTVLENVATSTFTHVLSKSVYPQLDTSWTAGLEFRKATSTQTHPKTVAPLNPYASPEYDPKSKY